jgi:endonuclease YncB( thermonuclease family)
MRVAHSFSICAVMSVAVVLPCRAESLNGPASVLDGDSIEIEGERIRILGIDAPESGQLCFRKSEPVEEGAWRCGRQAAQALAEWLGEQSVTCDTTAKGIRNGWLSHCIVADHDIAEWLAGNGWAVPSPTTATEIVRAAADQARADERGIWSSAFTMPWEWRQAR